jgi:hypothetical protein
MYKLLLGDCIKKLEELENESVDFSTFFWIDAVSRISAKISGTVFCGSTADTLKKRLGFQQKNSYTFNKEYFS